MSDTSRLMISVFGSARPLSSNPIYQDAYKLGSYLGKNGYTVLTGGYMGTMEAVSKGVNENGGHSIGVTCDEIEKWRPIKPNQWVQEEWRCDSLIERMNKLVENCDLVIGLPGGAGTLAEISLCWNRMLIKSIRAKKILLPAVEWQRLFFQMQVDFPDCINENDLSSFTFYDNISSLIQNLEEFL